MKEMEYKQNSNERYEVLDSGIKNGFPWMIISYFNHPCAYIGLPKKHKYYGKFYEDIEIDCHGGLTFSKFRFLADKLEIFKNHWVIGWDYAHLGDYHFGLFSSMLLENKKWTTKEIKKEVFDVIKQLKVD